MPHNRIVLKRILTLIGFIYFSTIGLFGQSISPKSPTFQFIQELSSQSSSSQYSSPLGANSEQILNNINQNVPRYGSGLDFRSNQAVNQAYIQNQIKNDPLYHQPSTSNPFKNKQLQQIEELHALIKEESNASPTESDFPSSPDYLKQTIYYRQAFNELLQMQNGTKAFSIRRAIFLVENAYLDNKLNYDKFLSLINNKVNLCKKLMAASKIKANDNLGKNYIIQKLYSEKILIYKNDTVISRVINPYRYDFNDFMGNKDWTKMFVSKLLRTNKGQCHSLPLNYLCIAEGLNAKAYLAFAPEHSYIMFPDNNGQFWNFETTNGSITSDKWVMASGYVNTLAIQNNLYMTALSEKRLLAFCIADLLMGYTNKFYYDNFVKEGIKAVLSLDPTSLQGLVMHADFALLETKKMMKQEGLNTMDDIKPNHKSHKLYTEWQARLDKISDAGYMGMPKNNYQDWLLTLKDEEQRQEQQKLRNTVIGNVGKRK